MALSPQAICIGDNCIDQYLNPINHRFVGGNAVNVATYLQKSAIQTAYIGIVGDDPEGQLLLDTLRKRNLDISRCIVVPGRSALTEITLTEIGDRVFGCEYLGPSTPSTLSDETIQYILKHELAHLTLQGCFTDLLPIIKSTQNMCSSFDYSDRCSATLLNKTIGNVDIAFFSLPNADMKSAAEFAVDIAAKGPHTVVITLGAHGSLAFNKEMHFQPAVSVDVIDTLGAGDAFIGTFLALFLTDCPISQCMKCAAEVASVTCTHFGAYIDNFDGRTYL